MPERALHHLTCASEERRGFLLGLVSSTANEGFPAGASLQEKQTNKKFQLNFYMPSIAQIQVSVGTFSATERNTSSESETFCIKQNDILLSFSQSDPTADDLLPAQDTCSNPQAEERLFRCVFSLNTPAPRGTHRKGLCQEGTCHAGDSGNHEGYNMISPPCV